MIAEISILLEIIRPSGLTNETMLEIGIKLDLLVQQTNA